MMEQPTSSDSTGMDSSRERKVIFHFVRHAKAEHNSKDPVSGERNWDMVHPHLTTDGFAQTKIIESFLPPPSKISLILSSPLIRCLETTWSGLFSYVDSGTPVIAYPDIREGGRWGSSIGADVATLQSLADQNLGRDTVDWSLLVPGWESPDSSSRASLKRYGRARCGLYELSIEALKSGGGKWKGIDVGGYGPGDMEIVVVSLGTFLKNLMHIPKDQDVFHTTEVKSFEMRDHTTLPNGVVKERVSFHWAGSATQEGIRGVKAFEWKF